MKTHIHRKQSGNENGNGMDGGVSTTSKVVTKVVTVSGNGEIPTQKRVSGRSFKEGEEWFGK